jgi:hypothetical protein
MTIRTTGVWDILKEWADFKVEELVPSDIFSLFD